MKTGFCCTAKRYAAMFVVILCALSVAACDGTYDPNYDPTYNPWPRGEFPGVRLHEGDTREQVARTLSDAWYHAVCEENPPSPYFLKEEDRTWNLKEVYLYGPHTVSQVGVVVVVYTMPEKEHGNGGIYHFGSSFSPVEFTPDLGASADTRKQWLAEQSNCLPPELFTK